MAELTRPSEQEVSLRWHHHHHYSCRQLRMRSANSFAFLTVCPYLNLHYKDINMYNYIFFEKDNITIRFMVSQSSDHQKHFKEIKAAHFFLKKAAIHCFLQHFLFL